MKQMALDLARPAAPTLDNFVPGGNAELLQCLRALAAGGAERFVYLWGGAGCGRTHLLKAVAVAAGASGRYVACAPGASLPPAAGAACAAIDDAHRLDGAGQVALFNLYNEIKAGGGSLVVSGDVPPARLAVRADLATRLAWGLVYEVQPLSDDERREALARHARARGFDLAPEVADYLLARVRRDLPTLLATIDALDRHSLETRRAVTVPLARELLNDAAGGG